MNRTDNVEWKMILLRIVAFILRYWMILSGYTLSGL